MFGTLPGGLGTLIDRLAELSARRLRPGLPVRALRRHGRPAGGWGSARAPDPEYLDADAVVLAVPAPAARKLLADVGPAASAAFGEVELASMAVVALALPADAPLPEASGVLIGPASAHGDGTPFTAKAFTFSSRKWAHLAGAGPLLVRGSVGRFGEAALLQRDDVELVPAVRADLAELTGVTAAPVDTVVHALGRRPAAVRRRPPRPGRADRNGGRPSVPGLAVAGAACTASACPAASPARTRPADHRGLTASRSDSSEVFAAARSTFVIRPRTR